MKAIIPAIMLALCACSAFPAAEMRLPANLQSYPGDPILGIDGWTHGRFKVDEYSGGYERSETRLVFADVFDRRAAHADFTIAGPYIDGYIDARCRMRERALRFDEISITARPMAYRCEFLSQGRTFPFHLELQESVSDLASALSRHERRGEIAFGGEILQIRSIHHL